MIQREVVIISPADSAEDIIVKLADGNPGALSCLGEILQVGLYKPGALCLFPLCVDMFARLGLRGASLYMLWNDCLDRSVSGVVRLVDEWRRGVVDDDFIHRHVNASGGRGIPIPFGARRWDL